MNCYGRLSRFEDVTNKNHWKDEEEYELKREEGQESGSFEKSNEQRNELPQRRKYL
jgi:hypothetical protein